MEELGAVGPAEVEMLLTPGRLLAAAPKVLGESGILPLLDETEVFLLLGEVSARAPEASCGWPGVARLIILVFCITGFKGGVLDLRLEDELATFV